MFGARRFTTGIQLVPQNTVAPALSGDIRYNSTTNFLQIWGAVGLENIVTDVNNISLSNKTLVNAILNTPTADTITGIAGGPLTVQSASGQNLVLTAQGAGVVTISGTTTTLQGVLFASNTISGAAGSTFTVESANNQNLALTAQGTGIATLSGASSVVQGFGFASNTISGATGSDTVLQSASNFDLELNAQGTGNILLQIGGVTGATLTNGGNVLLPNQLQVSATTNQIRLGVTNTITLTAPAPAASVTYTMPDVGTSSSFIMADGVQSINGIKKFTDSTDYTEISTPANPSAGVLRIYPKTDGKFYTLDSSGNETQIGTGSGSGSGMNYVTNPGFESNTNGWAAYANTAQSFPVNGTGGSPVTTITRTTSNPLVGAASGLITKDANNRQGEGVSFDFTIDSAFQAQVLTFSFNYIVASGAFNAGSTTQDSDLEMWIYDKTNGVLIPVTPFKLDSNSSITPNIFQGSFQTSPNSTSYRLILHIATTNASAWAFQFDNVSISPSVPLAGQSLVAARYSTVSGQSLTGSANNIINFDTKTIDTANAVTTGGSWAFTAPVAGFYRVHFSVHLDGVASAQNQVLAIYKNGSLYSQTIARSPSSGSSDTQYQITDMVPLDASNYIQAVVNPGSSCNLDTSSAINHISIDLLETTGPEQDGRVITARMSLSTTQSIPNNTLTVVNYDTVDFDTNAAASVPAGTYTIPVSGYYEVNVLSEFNNSSTTGLRATYLFINGVLTNVLGFNAPGTVGSGNGTLHNGAATIKVNAGDVLEIQVQQQSGGSLNIAPSGAVANEFSITRISGPALPTATETVAARYTQASSPSTFSNPGSFIIYSVKDYDTHAAYNNSTGTYTVPVSGKYSIKAAVLGTDNTTGDGVSVVIYINGSQTAYNVFPVPFASNGITVYTDDTVNLRAGDTVQIFAICSHVFTLNSVDQGTRFTIERVGN